MKKLEKDANKIVKITKNHLTSEKVATFFDELSKEDLSDDTKDLLAAINLLLNPPKQKASKFIIILFIFLVITHFIIVLGMIVSFFILPFTVKWYIALPLCAFIVFLGSNRVTCKLTEFENYLRTKIGLPKIGGFVGHYYVKPFKKLIKINSYFRLTRTKSSNPR